MFDLKSFVISGAGKAVMDLISSDHSFKHTPIPKKLEMPWKTDIFQNKLPVGDVVVIIF